MERETRFVNWPTLGRGPFKGSHQYICKCLYFREVLKFGAGNEIRTRDPDLGKVVLYQLSYSRNKRGTSFEVVRILQKFWGNATFNSTFFAPQRLNA